MITADPSHGSDRVAPVVERMRTPLPSVTVSRSALATAADIACCILSLLAAGAAGVPVVWGLALHQPALVVSGGCAMAMAVIALLNRLLAPDAARRQPVPFLAALDARHWVLAACLSLAACALVVLASSWP